MMDAPRPIALESRQTNPAALAGRADSKGLPPKGCEVWTAPVKVFDIERVVNVSQRLLVEAPSRRCPGPGDLDTERHESRDRRRVRRVPVVPSEHRSPRIPFLSFPIRRQAPSCLVAHKAVSVKIPCDADVYEVGGEPSGLRHTISGTRRFFVGTSR